MKWRQNNPCTISLLHSEGADALDFSKVVLWLRCVSCNPQLLTLSEDSQLLIYSFGRGIMMDKENIDPMAPGDNIIHSDQELPAEPPKLEECKPRRIRMPADGNFRGIYQDHEAAEENKQIVKTGTTVHQRIQAAVIRYFGVDPEVMRNQILPGIEPQTKLYVETERLLAKNVKNYIRNFYMTDTVLDHAFTAIKSSPPLGTLSDTQEKVHYYHSFKPHILSALLSQLLTVFDIDFMKKGKMWSEHMRYTWIYLLRGLRIFTDWTRVSQRTPVDDEDRKAIYDCMREAMGHWDWPAKKYNLYDVPLKMQTIDTNHLRVWDQGEVIMIAYDNGDFDGRLKAGGEEDELQAPSWMKD